jgi:hypothetical protein
MSKTVTFSALSTLLFGLCTSAVVAQGATYRVSSTIQGLGGNHHSDQPALSADGRWVAFASRSDNLVPGDSNFSKDIFVKDLWSGYVIRVSVGTGGLQANGDSSSPSISADGRYITFETAASNLIPNDFNNYGDVFVYDRYTQTTTRVSVDSNGQEGNHASMQPRISGDGRHIVFYSQASNLVSGDSNGQGDVFVRRRDTNETIRASIAWNSGQGTYHSGGGDISDDGRYVVFISFSPNLVPGDTNNAQDVFLRDTLNDTTTLVSVRFGTNTPGNDHSYWPRIDGNGDNIVFHSSATDLLPIDTNGVVDVFVRRRTTGKTLCASMTENFVQSWGHSMAGSISADGRYVTFHSTASNLTSKSSFAQDIFVKDMVNWSVKIVNLTSEGYTAQDSSGMPVISDDGRYVAFSTMDDGMVPDDTNAYMDVVVNEISHHVTASDRAKIGRTLVLNLESPRDAGKAYLALASTNTQFGIPLGGRLFPLDNDSLMSLSITSPSVFVDFSGVFDAFGKAQAKVVIPAIPSLLNFEFLVAYTLVDPTNPTIYSGFSNAVPFTIGL